MKLPQHIVTDFGDLLKSLVVRSTELQIVLSSYGEQTLPAFAIHTIPDAPLGLQIDDYLSKINSQGLFAHVVKAFIQNQSTNVRLLEFYHKYQSEIEIVGYPGDQVHIFANLNTNSLYAAELPNWLVLCDQPAVSFIPAVDTLKLQQACREVAYRLGRNFAVHREKSLASLNHLSVERLGIETPLLLLIEATAKSFIESLSVCTKWWTEQMIRFRGNVKIHLCISLRESTPALLQRLATEWASAPVFQFTAEPIPIAGNSDHFSDTVPGPGLFQNARGLLQRAISYTRTYGLADNQLQQLQYMLNKEVSCPTKIDSDDFSPESFIREWNLLGEFSPEIYTETQRRAACQGLMDILHRYWPEAFASLVVWYAQNPEAAPAFAWIQGLSSRSDKIFYFRFWARSTGLQPEFFRKISQLDPADATLLLGAVINVYTRNPSRYKPIFADVLEQFNAVGSRELQQLADKVYKSEQNKVLVENVKEAWTSANNEFLALVQELSILTPAEKDELLCWTMEMGYGQSEFGNWIVLSSKLSAKIEQYCRQTNLVFSSRY